MKKYLIVHVQPMHFVRSSRAEIEHHIYEDQCGTDAQSDSENVECELKYSPGFVPQ